MKIIICNREGEILTQQNLAVFDEKKNVFRYKLPDDYPDCTLLRITTDEPRTPSYTINVNEFRNLTA